MHIAARPPESVYFRKDRDTLEKRSDRWLKELARRSHAPAFDLERWIADWQTEGGNQPGLKANYVPRSSHPCHPCRSLLG